MTKKIVFKGALALVIMLAATSAVFAQKDAPEYTKWNVGMSLGFAPGDNIPLVMGLHGAYFLNHKYGAGLMARRKYDTDYENLFFGAAFFADWGRSNSKLFFPTRLGFGIEKYTTPKNEYNEPAFYLSAGIAYRCSKLISIGVFADFDAVFEDLAEFERDNFVINAGIRFHF